jgi:hypothetical protein
LRLATAGEALQTGPSGPVTANVALSAVRTGAWMRVSKDDMICGVPASAARQLMRAYFDDHSAGVACDVLGLGRDAARNQLRAFESAGYIRHIEEGSPACW